MRMAAAVAGLVLLAGCASGPEAAPPVPEPVVEEPAWQRFEQTYQLTRTQVQTPAGSAGLGGSNCVMFDDDATVRGTVAIRWDAEATDPEMELVLSGSDDLRFHTGNGEIVLELQGFEVGGRRPGSPLAWQVSQGALAGLANDLQGTMDVSLDYLLEDPEDEFTPDDNWSCSLGH